MFAPIVPSFFRFFSLKKWKSSPFSAVTAFRSFPPRFHVCSFSLSVQHDTGPSGVGVWCSLPMLGPCAQRQRCATACCAYIPTDIYSLLVNKLSSSSSSSSLSLTHTGRTSDTGISHLSLSLSLSHTHTHIHTHTPSGPRASWLPGTVSAPFILAVPPAACVCVCVCVFQCVGSLHLQPAATSASA